MRNKKKPGLCVFLFSLAVLWISAPAAAQTLRYSDHEPLGGMRTRFINDVFFAALEKESNGRLKVDAHWGGELSSGYDALRLVGEGAVTDMAIVVPEYAPDRLPLHQIFKSFPTGPTGDQQLQFYRRMYAEIPAFPAELDKQNVVSLFFATGYPVGFFSTSPLSSLQDIRGGKWRTASFWHQGFLRNAGAEPVSMAWGPGVRDALHNGALNGLMVNIDSGDDIQAQQAAPNLLVSPDLWLGHVYILVMNKDKWNSLSKADQDAISRAAASAYQLLGPVMDNSFTTLLADMKKNGVNVRLLQPAELRQWQSVTRFQAVQAAWVKEQEGKGGTGAAAALEQVSAILNSLQSPTGRKAD